MTVGGYGQMRATDADRDSIGSILRDAYAEGRLTLEEFHTRSDALLQAKTYAELGSLTADLQKPVAYRPQPGYPAYAPPTNSLAIASLVCGLSQFFAPFIAGIPAIVCGHVARSQIRRTGERGDGMAMAGLVLGYIGVVGPILLVLLAILLIAVH